MRKNIGKLTLDFDSERLRRHGPYILAGLITLLVVSLYLDDHRVLATWELGIQDAMVSIGKHASPPSDVVVVTIDDNAVGKLGAWPWDNERVGYLVGMLAEYKPKAIGLDFEIAAEATDDPVGARFLADMIAKAGNVVLPLRFSLGDTGPIASTVDDFIFKSSLVTFDRTMELMDHPYPQARRLTLPYEDACRAAWGLGQVNTWQDVDGKVRRDPLVVRFQGEYFPSMALQLALLAQGVTRPQVQLEPGQGVKWGSSIVPCDDAGMLLIDYRGPAGTLKSVSAARVLEGESIEREIAGKVVVVGVTAKGYGTSLNTPVSERLPRTEKIATVTANLLAGRYISTVRLSTFLDMLILMVIGAFCGIVLPRTTVIYRVVILLVMAFLFINLNYVLYNSFQLITKTLYPTLQILLFVAFAPVMKLWVTDSGAAAAQSDGSRPGKSVRSGRTGRVISNKGGQPSGSPKVGTDSVPTRVVSEGGPVSAIGGLERTVAIGTIGSAPDDTTVLGSSSSPGNVPGGTVSDLMNLSPQPLGANVSDSGAMLATPPVSDILPGQKLGRYEILGVLGQGAMGTVYKGQDPAIDRMVALKTIRAGIGQDPGQAQQLRERLVREAKAAGKLSHPNIVTVYDVGAEGELNYIAMEYLEGYTLEQLITKSVQLNYFIAARIIMQVCAALDYAHRAGIVHRDIKPANIMVLDNFEIKVTDFGIARFDSPQMSMTQTGIAMGTPHYISPEQLRGESVDRRCDIFSLGVVAYELLTHKRPFVGDNISALIYSITQTNPPPPSMVDENIPGLFDMVIGRALAKNPIERYQSADQMAQDLKSFAQDMAAASYRI